MKNIFCILTAFLILFLVSCESIPTEADSPWPMKQIEVVEDFVEYKEVIEKPFAPEVFEEKEFIFLRLLTNEYKHEGVIGWAWKGMVKTQGTASDGICYTHAELNTDLNDSFIGMTGFGDNAAKVESIMDISNHPYLYKMDPYKAIFSVFAIPVSKVDRENVRKLLEYSVSGEKIFCFYCPDAILMPGRHTSNKNKVKKYGPFPEIEDEQPLVLPMGNYFEDYKFLCSGFVAHVLKKGIKRIRNFMNVYDMDTHGFTVSDLVDHIPGIQKLYSATYINYEAATRNFVKNNPEWAKYGLDKFKENAE